MGQITLILSLLQKVCVSASFCSNDKIKVICPNCKREKTSVVYAIYNNKSIQCSCGDGTSYPEKFLISLLDQLKVKYKHDSYWIDGKRYDFYLPDYNCIIECHGIQHYKQTNRKGNRARTLQEEQENDVYKKQLALDNNTNGYIILDCRKSELEWVKNSILQSELNDMLDLSDIDWLECEEFALKNRVKEVCEYWHIHNEINNEDLNINIIADKFNVSSHTIVRYLKRGAELDWCNYDSKEEKSKHIAQRSIPVEIFKDGISLGTFNSMRELERLSESIFGVKFRCDAIGRVCKGKVKTHKGFTFKHVDKQN